MKLRQVPATWLILVVSAIALSLLTIAIVKGAPARDSSTLPPAKQAILDRIEHVRQTAAAGYQPPPNPHFTPQPGPTAAPWGTGIFNIPQGPFSADEYDILNQWQNIVNGMHVNVYAGAYEHEKAQGLLVVILTSLDTTKVSGNVYTTATKVGALRITSADGSRLQLKSVQGSSFVFDAAARILTPSGSSSKRRVS